MTSPHKITKILYVEDNSGQARMLQQHVGHSGVELIYLPSAEAAEAHLQSHRYDIALIDYTLPGLNGLEFIRKLAPGESDMPVILLTSSGNERIAVEALEAGAADYIMKDAGNNYIQLLPSVMAAAYTRVRMTRELQNQQQLLLDYAKKLKESEQRLNLAIEGSGIGIWDLDLETKKLFWSDSLKKTFGMRSDEEPTVEFWKNTLHPEDICVVDNALKEHLEGKTPLYHAVFRERPASFSEHADDWRWTMGRGIALRDLEGKPYRILGSCMDITNQKKLEEQLSFEKRRAEEANQAKTEFLATMSHEIRTPMNSVIGLAGLLEKTELAARQREMVETLRTNADVLLQIINDLLDISRIEAGQMELEALPFSMPDLLKSLNDMFTEQAHTKKLRFEVIDKTAAANYIGDSGRLRQILVNLCGNAMKFTQQGGVTVTARADEDHVIISVADTGIGIMPEKMSQIFEKFVQADQSITRRFGGSGLGLWICRTLVEKMHGTITAESTPGMGSLFVLTLPLLKVSIAADTQPPAQEKPEKADRKKAENKPKILLVEDYAANVMVASFLLEELGYRYDVASSGVAAIEKVKNTAVNYAAILMDVQMPEMDGYEATHSIRRFESEKGRPTHHIIGLTAHAMSGDRERCLEAGMNDYMTKPIQPDELRQKLLRAEGRK